MGIFWKLYVLGKLVKFESLWCVEELSDCEFFKFVNDILVKTFVWVGGKAVGTFTFPAGILEALFELFIDFCLPEVLCSGF